MKNKSEIDENTNNTMQDYSDIINHRHYQSSTRPRMSLNDRAAQFAPFAALTGFDDCIDEEARLTDEKIELSEAQLEELNFRQQQLLTRIDEKPTIALTYFVADERKSGGRYVTKIGALKRIDVDNKFYIFTDGCRVSFSDVLSVCCEIT